MPELLLEVGCEEIPAGFMRKALGDFKGIAERELKANRVGFEKIEAVGTPRRLALVAFGVAARQEDLVREKVGPAKSVAFDGDGKPTRAAHGFAKGQGVKVSELTVIETDKGEYVCARKREQGKPTEEIFAQMLPQIITSIPFPKTMRWADSTLRFARPIHWIVAIFDGRVVPFEVLQGPSPWPARPTIEADLAKPS
jgi:glycyl-tRNA synthetase beta chain